jgi:hypothetical protein
MLLNSLILAFTLHLASAHPVHEQLVVQELSPTDVMSPPTFSSISTQAADNLLLSDVMGRERSINIFSGFTRDIDTNDFALDSKTENFTVLAPDNDAIRALPRKPWEDPQDYSAFGDRAYEGPDGSQRANKNLRNFVEAHIVMQSPWRPGQKAKTAKGDEIWLEEKDGKWLVRSVSCLATWSEEVH